MKINKYSYSKVFWEKKEKKLKKLKEELNKIKNIGGKEVKQLQEKINNVEFLIDSYSVYEQARKIILKHSYLFNLLVNLFDYNAQYDSSFEPREKARAFLTQNDLVIDPIYLLELAFLENFKDYKWGVFFSSVTNKLLKILGTAYLEICYGNNFDPLIRKNAKKLFLELWKKLPDFRGKTAVWTPNFESELEQCILQIREKYKKLKEYKRKQNFKSNLTNLEKKYIEENISFETLVYEKVAEILSQKFNTMISKEMIREEKLRLSLEKRIISKLEKIIKEIKSLSNLDFDYLNLKNNYEIKKLINSYIKRYMEGHSKRIVDFPLYWKFIDMPKDIRELERFATALEYFEDKMKKNQVKKIELHDIIPENEKYWLHSYLNKFMIYNLSTKQFEKRKFKIISYDNGKEKISTYKEFLQEMKKKK